MRRTWTSLSLLVALASPLAAEADDVTDTLTRALTAYETGDIKYALEEIDEGAAVGFGPMGGTGVVATYKTENDTQNERFKLSIMMDSPIVAGMAGPFGNAALMGAQGKLVRVGREKFLQQTKG